MKIKKIIFVLLLLVFILCINNFSYAYDQTDSEDDAGVITSRAEDWISTGTSEDSTLDLTDATTGFEEIAGLLWGIGIFVAVAVGMILGIRFMFSTPAGKAEIAKLVTPYIIGVVIIVGALTIWKLSINILDV